MNTYMRKVTGGNLPKLLLHLECGHSVKQKTYEIPKFIYCVRCKEIEHKEIVDQAYKNQIDYADPTREGPVCIHGVTACSKCGTSKQITDVVDLDSISF